MKAKTSITEYEIQKTESQESGGSSSYISEDFLTLKEETGKKISTLSNLVIIGFIVLLIMVAAMVVDSVYSHIEDAHWHIQYQMMLQEKLNQVK